MHWHNIYCGENLSLVFKITAENWNKYVTRFIYNTLPSVIFTRQMRNTPLVIDPIRIAA